MQLKNKEIFLALVRLGIEHQGLVHDAWCTAYGQEEVDWNALEV